MQWEVEQKFPVSDLPATTAKLAAVGATFEDPICQIDRYFNHPSREFAQTDEALRLRQVGDRNFITYKGPKVDPLTKTRRELELPLPIGQEIPEQYLQLFQALGFRPSGTVEKIRRPGQLVWQGHKVEIALDDVKSVGSFLELEITANDEGLPLAKSALQALCEHLGVGPSLRQSYLEMLFWKSS
jgi:adenylate cyclase, class 2